MDFESIKTWVSENPVKAAAVGVGVAGVVALVVSPKLRKKVGLSGVAGTKELPRHTHKSHHKAKRATRKHKTVLLK